MSSPYWIIRVRLHAGGRPHYAGLCSWGRHDGSLVATGDIPARLAERYPSKEAAESAAASGVINLITDDGRPLITDAVRRAPRKPLPLCLYRL